MGKRIKSKPVDKVVIYLRVSTEEQKKGNGLESQLAACEVYAERKGYTIVGILRDEALSGALCVDKRPGLKAALERCESGVAGAILVYAQDRLARSSGLFDELRTRAKKGGYRLETADGRILTDDEDELSGDAMAFVASIERKLIAKRLYGGRKERAAKDGRGTGSIPYGYIRTATGIAIDPDAAPIIRRVFALLDTTSYRKTVDTLNAEGMYKSGSTKWTVTLIQRIAANRELYTSGKRTSFDTVASEQWPIILQVEADVS